MGRSLSSLRSRLVRMRRSSQQTHALGTLSTGRCWAARALASIHPALVAVEACTGCLCHATVHMHRQSPCRHLSRCVAAASKLCSLIPSPVLGFASI